MKYGDILFIGAIISAIALAVTKEWVQIASMICFIIMLVGMFAAHRMDK